MEKILEKLSELGALCDQKALQLYSFEQGRGNLSKGPMAMRVISLPYPTLEGLKQYPYNDILKELIMQLYKKAPVVRGVRGDGNCLYRSIGYAILEQVLISDDQNEFLLKCLTILQEEPNFFNFFIEYPKGIKHPQEIKTIFLNYLLRIVIFSLEHPDNHEEVIEKLEHLFNFTEFDMAMVSFIRGLAISGVNYFRRNPDQDQIFFDQLSVLESEISEIGVYGAEGEQIVSSILARYLKMEISIFYLEKRQRDIYSAVVLEDVHKFAGQSQLINISLYYNPGHYQVCFSTEYSKKFYPSEYRYNEFILNELSQSKSLGNAKHIAQEGALNPNINRFERGGSPSMENQLQENANPVFMLPEGPPPQIINHKGGPKKNIYPEFFENTNQNQLPSLQNQLPLPRNQLPSPRNQLPSPRNQFPFPQSQLPFPQSQLPFPQSQLPSPQNQGSADYKLPRYYIAKRKLAESEKNEAGDTSNIIDIFIDDVWNLGNNIYTKLNNFSQKGLKKLENFFKKI